MKLKDLLDDSLREQCGELAQKSGFCGNSVGPSDHEIAMHLGTHIMGWKARAAFAGKDYIVFDLPDGHVIMWPRNWNPLERIEDAFVMEGKALSGPKERLYLIRLYDTVTGGMSVIGTTRLHRGLVHATPRQRSMAAYEATKEGK